MTLMCRWMVDRFTCVSFHAIRVTLSASQKHIECHSQHRLILTPATLKIHTTLHPKYSRPTSLVLFAPSITHKTYILYISTVNQPQDQSPTGCLRSYLRARVTYDCEVHVVRAVAVRQMPTAGLGLWSWHFSSRDWMRRWMTSIVIYGCFMFILVGFGDKPCRWRLVLQ